MGVLKSRATDLADCAFPLLEGIVHTVDPKIAFKDVSVAFLIELLPTSEDATRN